MTDEAPGNDWKLTLRYGRAATPFQHYALIADGVRDAAVVAATGLPAATVRLLRRDLVAEGAR